MLGYIANTDYDWYTFLRQLGSVDEVNFWQPSGGQAFHAVPPGAPFFLRLKSPYNAIGGFGFFAGQAKLPAWLAWDSFEELNGAPDFETMRRWIERYRQGPPDPLANYIIGCLMIAQPVFFSDNEWVREPADWHSNIVRGKGIDLSGGEGRRILDECRARAAGIWDEFGQAAAQEVLEKERYGKPTLVMPRIGQGIFRVSVMQAYEGACAVTGERSLPVLEAAHVVPYTDGGKHEVSNGLFLRTDIHKLYDHGYVTVTPDYRFEVGRRLRDEYENGRTYYQLRGQPIRLPENEEDRPNKHHLEWHANQVFKG
ncbi:MAG: HNH endonuclease [Actinobacteria bacterium]|nr:MAG: HNH endonuclease [Actinomycetota bacterium]